MSSEEAWQKHRFASLGSSDAPTIVGASSFESPFGLWAVKTGRLEEKREVTRRMRAGHALEAEIEAELRAERPELDFYDPGDFTVIYDDEAPWRHATVDRLYGDKDAFVGLEPNRADHVLEALDNASGVAEFKTVAGWMKDAWGDEPSAYAIVQTHHQMLVTGLESSIVAAWFGLGEDFRIYDLPANLGLLEAVDRAEREFQAAIENGQPPPPDESERTTKALAALYPRETAPELELDEEADEWLRILENAQARRKSAESRIREAQNWLKSMLGEHEAGLAPNGSIVTWKTIERAEHTVAASSYRQLRVRKLANAPSAKP